VTSSYLEGEQNQLGEFGYNCDGKKGKLQIVIGLLTDAEGEPLAVRVFAGNTADPVTVVDQIKILQEQFQVQEFVFVGDRGMVKSKGIQAFEKANLHYITALTDPQIRSLLGPKILQLELFSEQICEVEGVGVRYVLRKNEKEAARERHRLEDKLEKLTEKIAARNEQVKNKPRCRPEWGNANCKPGRNGTNRLGGVAVRTSPSIRSLQVPSTPRFSIPLLSAFYPLQRLLVLLSSCTNSCKLLQLLRKALPSLFLSTSLLGGDTIRLVSWNYATRDAGRTIMPAQVPGASIPDGSRQSRRPQSAVALR
jgi:Transposase DDE domain